MFCNKIDQIIIKSNSSFINPKDKLLGKIKDCIKISFISKLSLNDIDYVIDKKSESIILQSLDQFKLHIKFSPVHK